MEGLKHLKYNTEAGRTERASPRKWMKVKVIVVLAMLFEKTKDKSHKDVILHKRPARHR